MDQLNVGAIKPPIAIAAKAPRFVSAFPEGKDQLWVADVKACRHGVQCDVFEDVLFVESNGRAFIYGIEFEDGYPKGLRPELAEKQRAFIQFLRDETRQDNNALGPTSAVFRGHEYSSEGKATAAYIAARETDLMIGVGYRNDEGEYELVGLDTSDGSWLEAARCTLPFDELT
jgi:hypothetical protein